MRKNNANSCTLSNRELKKNICQPPIFSTDISNDQADSELKVPVIDEEQIEN